MGFFKSKPNQPEAPEIQPLAKWDCAKVVPDCSIQNAELPLGWYIAKDGPYFVGIKPDPSQQGLIRKWDLPTPMDVQDWLGVPVPQFMLEEYRTQRDKLYQKNQESLALLNVKEEEKRQRKELASASDSEDSLSHPAVRTRPRETHIRFTEEEFALLHTRVKRSGLPQSIFIREAALKGQILIDNSRKEAITELKSLNTQVCRLRGDLGKLGGLLKAAIKPNEEQYRMNQEEWNSLLDAIRSLMLLKASVERTMVKINGCLNHEFK